MFKASTLLRQGKRCEKEMKAYLSANAEHLPAEGLPVHRIERPFYNGWAILLPDGNVESSDDYTGPTGAESINEFAKTHGLDALSSAVEAVGKYLKRHESR